ncbi:MAG: T9SS type A sorting domain-containing protein [Saprospiraceae bacterium]
MNKFNKSGGFVRPVAGFFRGLVALAALALLPAFATAQSLNVNLSCNGQVNVTLNANCEFVLPISSVLAGNFDNDNDGTSAPLSAFQVTVQDGTPANGAAISGCGQFSYMVTVVPGSGVTGFTTCWGNVRAEDKTPPTVVAPTAPAGPLFCDQLDAISLTQLPFNVSRCYRTNSAGQFINAGGTVISVAQLPLAFRTRILLGGGFPTVTDNCSNVQVCVNDVLTFASTNPNCGDITLTRTFTVKDDGPCVLGNGEVSQPATTSYQIIFTRPTFADVDTTGGFIQISCNDNSRPLLPVNQFGNANPASLETEFPFISTGSGPLFLDEAFCNLAVTVEDGPRTVTCVNTYKFQRTFSVIDWCQPNAAPLIFTRLVKVGDFTPPTILAPTQDLNFDGIADNGLFFSTNNVGCVAFFFIPAPTVTDNCSSTIGVTAVIFPNGNLSATPIGSFNVGQLTSAIPAGNHILRYRAVDICGNAATVDVPITIGDASAPIAKCEDGLNISIGGSGVAIITANDIDKNSYDDCGPVTLAIACVNQNNQLINPALGYQPAITVTCADLGTKRISLRVTDAAGNVNFCWLDVLIEDKAAPVCIPPTPRTILCSNLPSNFPNNVGTAFGLDPVNVGALLNDLFGTSNSFDNCPNTTIAVLTPQDNRDNCGIGTFVRRFRITDAQGLQTPICQQVITVLEQHNYRIGFPGDSDSDGCAQNPVDNILFREIACDLIAVSVHPDTFSATADECYKIRNTIEVINWCEYDGISAPPINIPRDADGDNNLNERTWVNVIPAANPTSLLDDRAIVDRDSIPLNFNDIADLPTFATANITNYGTSARRGYFRYIQFVKVYDNIAPTVVVNPDNQSIFCDFDGDCRATAQLSFTASDLCSPAAVSVTVDLDLFVVDANNDGIITTAEFQTFSTVPASGIVRNGQNFTVTLPNLDLGRHAIRINVTDGCGNRTARIIVFNVNDCKAPAPICINGLTATLMPNGNGGGMAAVWASDFIASGITDCTPQIKFALYRASTASAPGFVPNPIDTGLILTCADAATTIVRVYAIDGNNLSDYCTTNILVQQNTPGVCSGSGGFGSIAGVITTETNQSVQGVQVSVSGTANNALVTTAAGNYTFANLPLGGDYTVTPQLNANHINGVSTFDLVLISKHILGITPFTSPFQMLAADANNSQAVTTLDLISIRRLILGLDTQFTNNLSWRFVDADFSFPNSANPWATTFPEVFNQNNLTGNMMSADFVAVKIGDVNRSATTTNLTSGTSAEERGNGRVELRVDDREMTAGNTYQVAVRAGELEGFQGTLALKGAELLSITDAAATAENFGTQLADLGLLSVSYNGKVDADQELFTLVVRSMTDQLVSEMLQLNDRVTVSEGYTANGSIGSLVLNFGTQVNTVAGAFEVAQNTPNPFATETMIGYTLDAAAEVTLTVQDVTGKVVLVRRLAGNAGYNTTTLNRADVARAPGVLFYTLTDGVNTATKKMILQ